MGIKSALAGMFGRRKPPSTDQLLSELQAVAQPAAPPISQPESEPMSDAAPKTLVQRVADLEALQTEMSKKLTAVSEQSAKIGDIAGRLQTALENTTTAQTKVAEVEKALGELRTAHAALEENLRTFRKEVFG